MLLATLKHVNVTMSQPQRSKKPWKHPTGQGTGSTQQQSSTKKSWKHPASKYASKKSEHPRHREESKTQSIILDEATLERISVLREDMAEFRKAEKKYARSGHTTLEHEARRQYDSCADMVDDLLNPFIPQKRIDTSWISLLCLPCLVAFSCLCVISTAAVGEVEKNSARNQHIVQQFGKLGEDLVFDIKKKYVRSKN